MKKKVIIAGLAVLGMITVVLLFCVVLNDKRVVKVYMKGESGKIGDTVNVELKVSDIPEEYQASSFVIAFDNQKLKFKGILQGNVSSIDKNSGEKRFPEWQYDVESANASGTVSTMYLDMTAGEQPLSREGFRKGSQDVLFRMEFEILPTCANRDNLELLISQATFASVDEELSLALQKKNILAESYKITVIE